MSQNFEQPSNPEFIGLSSETTRMLDMQVEDGLNVLGLSGMQAEAVIDKLQ